METKIMKNYPIGEKNTWEKQANDIVSGTIEISDNELPQLLGWLQDGNWPGATQIANYLIGFGKELVSPIREILVGKDILWSYWLLNTLIAQFPKEVCNELKDSLIKIANEIDDEGAHIAALEICAKHQLIVKDDLIELLNDRMKVDSENVEDYQDILSDYLK